MTPKCPENLSFRLEKDLERAGQRLFFPLLRLSFLLPKVFLPVSVIHPSAYRIVLRYLNPNPEAVVGEVTVAQNKTSKPGAEVLTEFGDTTHAVLLPPTGPLDPQFVTVSGDKGIYAAPFDLEQGRWSVAVKIPNDDPMAQEILVVGLTAVILPTSGEGLKPVRADQYPVPATNVVAPETFVFGVVTESLVTKVLNSVRSFSEHYARTLYRKSEQNKLFEHSRP